MTKPNQTVSLLDKAEREEELSRSGGLWRGLPATVQWAKGTFKRQPAIRVRQ